MKYTSRMRSLVERLVRLMCRSVYKMMPALFWTRLAASPLGRILGTWLAPSGESYYQCDFGIRLRLSRDDARASGIAYMGRTNPLETELVRKYLNAGETLVQIGAYKDGWFSIVGSQVVGPQGRVVCFEPIPEYAECLKHNVDVNNLHHNITVEQLAVSDATAETRFAVDGVASSMATTDSPNTVTVKTVALDEYCASESIKTVDFLIIDAEGAEPLVLRGARRTLENSVSYLLMEVYDDVLRQAGTTADQLILTVISMGFYPYVITRGGLCSWHPGKTSETLNMFFTRRPALPAGVIG